MKLKLTRNSAKDLGLIWYENKAWEVEDYLRHRWPDLKLKGNLDLSYLDIESLPPDLKVGGSLDLGGCKSLKSLPSGLEVGRNLILFHTKSLKSLPPDLKVGGEIKGLETITIKTKERVYFLEELKRLTLLETKGDLDLSLNSAGAGYSLPSTVRIGGDFSLAFHVNLKELPMELFVGGNLNLFRCTDLKSLPKKLKVGGDLDIRSCNSLDPNCLIGLRTKVAGKIYANPKAAQFLKQQETSIKKDHEGTLILWSFNGVLPDGLAVEKDLDLKGSTITSLPEKVTVGGTLFLTNCKKLDKIPAMFVGKDLVLRGTNIKYMSKGLKVKGRIIFDDSTLTGADFEKLTAILGD